MLPRTTASAPLRSPERLPRRDAPDGRGRAWPVRSTGPAPHYRQVHEGRGGRDVGQRQAAAREECPVELPFQVVVAQPREPMRPRCLGPCRSGTRARRFGLKNSPVPANLSDHAIQASASASSGTSNRVGACASSKRKPPSCRRAAGCRRETPGRSRADGKPGTPDQWHGTAATHARPRGSSPPHGDAPKPWTITPGPFCR